MENGENPIKSVNENDLVSGNNNNYDYNKEEDLDVNKKFSAMSTFGNDFQINDLREREKRYKFLEDKNDNIINNEIKPESLNNKIELNEIITEFKEIKNQNLDDINEKKLKIESNYDKDVNLKVVNIAENLYDNYNDEDTIKFNDLLDADIIFNDDKKFKIHNIKSNFKFMNVLIDTMTRITNSKSQATLTKSANSSVSNKSDNSYPYSFRSQIEKYKRMNIIEWEFENCFQLEADIEYKETFGYSTYSCKLEKNKLILYNRRNIKSDNKKFDKSSLPKVVLNSNPILVLDFDFISVKTEIKTDVKTIKIEVIGAKKTFIFRIKDKILFEKFIHFLHFFVTNSKGYKKNLFNICMKSDFYKNLHITENAYKLNAKSGDIILFKGFEFPARCQRFITCENYGKVIIKLRSCCFIN